MGDKRNAHSGVMALLSTSSEKSRNGGGRAGGMLPLSLDARTADRSIPGTKEKTHQSFDIVPKTLLAF